MAGWTVIHGVDVSDPYRRRFDTSKWNSLQAEGHNYVLQCHKHLSNCGNDAGHANAGRFGQRSGRGDNNQNVSAANVDNDSNHEFLSDCATGNGDNGGLNGQGFGCGAYGDHQG